MVEEQEVDADDVRRLMGSWPTGVGVLTSATRGEPRGCTANAFTSLSLDPLLMLACFGLGSNTLQAVRDSARFGVNILASDQEHVSRRFAGKAGDKFEGLPYALVDGTPVLEGVLGWLVCDVRDEVAGGDHAIVIGAPRRGNVREEAEPLLLYRGRYGQVYR